MGARGTKGRPPVFRRPGKPITSHSTTPVPFFAALPADCALKFNRSAGGVADVAPTMLTYMGIDIPQEMTGKNFLA